MQPYDYGEWLVKTKDGYSYYERITKDTPYQEDAVILAQGREILITGKRVGETFLESVRRAARAHSYSWHKAKKYGNVDDDSSWA